MELGTSSAKQIGWGMFMETSRLQTEPPGHGHCSGLVALEGEGDLPARGAQKAGWERPLFSYSCCEGRSPVSLLSLPQAEALLPFLLQETPHPEAAIDCWLYQATAPREQPGAGADAWFAPQGR